MKNLFSKDVCFVSNSAQSTMNEFINGLIVYFKLELLRYVQHRCQNSLARLGNSTWKK